MSETPTPADMPPTVGATDDVELTAGGLRALRRERERNRILGSEVRALRAKLDAVRAAVLGLTD
ncbi:hypothetical protein IU510_30365 [Nocardia cyriacigeorgica]|uniref:hypothetical protein n=1 Tax=Nocardia cyriacigeorgica TaxID=135487 RepID=UPI001892E588|nr:hypothetical protein [Nocardia cyriacigeorgica]MBF6102326.1 hypothetical protein [Nocardia cyriacigeorgica]MBF6162167.1 hypothetical protein [Nocardia cyriacigeorgica]MBF6200771.1 hypothetical protein [Nocardia cyriacigeorgica]MBF6518032.1 hypothetical protein [Nocardia cyriacigeorgica]